MGDYNSWCGNCGALAIGGNVSKGPDRWLIPEPGGYDEISRDDLEDGMEPMCGPFDPKAVR